jgi:hypothetical protein
MPDVSLVVTIALVMTIWEALLGGACAHQPLRRTVRDGCALAPDLAPHLPDAVHAPHVVA